MLFPKDFVLEVALTEMNKVIIGEPVQYGEFLRWLGLWFLMATVVGPRRRDFWSSPPIDEFDGAPFCLNKWISRTCFEAILSSLRFTDSAPLTQKDGFWEIRQLIDAWNENMDANFRSSWITCFDESMMMWMDQCCPGFMYVTSPIHLAMNGISLLLQDGNNVPGRAC